MDEAQYRFPKWKDATWNSFERQRERYQAIAPFLGKDAVGAEIGVYKGGFADFLLPHCRKLYLVDVWYRAGGFWSTGIHDDSRVATVIEILKAYKPEIERGQVEPVVEWSDRFLRSMPDRSFDFIYIDASHSFEETAVELVLAASKLKPDSCLLGDDYDPDPASKQHGVFLAVNAMVAAGVGTLVLDASRQWGLRIR